MLHVRSLGRRPCVARNGLTALDKEEDVAWTAESPAMRALGKEEGLGNTVRGGCVPWAAEPPAERALEKGVVVIRTSRCGPASLLMLILREAEPTPADWPGGTARAASIWDLRRFAAP